MKCIKCRKEKQDSSFINLRNKKCKNCFDCRENSRLWREKNKKRVSEYNKFTIQKCNNNKLEENIIYAKKKELPDLPENWIKFDSQADVATKLSLYKPNINKVIKGILQTTGGYQIKLIIQKKEKEEIETWDKIKEKNSFKNMVKGHPSNHRTLHETIDSIIGKKCGKCKDWKPLIEYNKDKHHWDKLRVECKECLVKYRKENRRKIQDGMNKYEKKRKQIDPEFKLMKTLRSRLYNALKCKNAEKLKSTLELTGCSLVFLKGFLEGKFTEGMTWENHGKWHVDHIIPCNSFNLLEIDEQQKCFHYTNLQPLWAADNLSKGNRMD